MVDLDEGMRLLTETNRHKCGSAEWSNAGFIWEEWLDRNAPALIAELRAARETIATLRGELECLKTKETCP